MIEILWSNVIPPTSLLSDFSKKQVANDWHSVILVSPPPTYCTIIIKSQQQVATDWIPVIKCYSSNLSVIRFLIETGGKWLRFSYSMLFNLPLSNQKFSQQLVANDWDSLIRCYSSSLSITRNFPSSRWPMIEILWFDVCPPPSYNNQISSQSRWLMIEILWFDVSLHPPLNNQTSSQNSWLMTEFCHQMLFLQPLCYQISQRNRWLMTEILWYDVIPPPAQKSEILPATCG